MNDTPPLEVTETWTTASGDILKSTNIASIRPEPEPKKATSKTKPVMALFILLMAAACYFFPSTPKGNTTKTTTVQAAKTPKP